MNNSDPVTPTNDQPPPYAEHNDYSYYDYELFSYSDDPVTVNQTNISNVKPVSGVDDSDISSYYDYSDIGDDDKDIKTDIESQINHKSSG